MEELKSAGLVAFSFVCVLLTFAGAAMLGLLLGTGLLVAGHWLGVA